MNHRILLMSSGLLMMFAVFAAIMWLGAFLKEADGADKNGYLSLVFTALTLIVFFIAMAKRKTAKLRIKAEIDRTFASTDHILASSFALNLNVSLDDARDILDKEMHSYRWRREELPAYDARYYAG